ncbi:LOW QUALITY PROTEIN: active breakpoint cluster region-related protein-like [Pecten maximus]|uniref:LOW QUALITY PROTEIN: active breakpoint cluster region-related protein-like n=1 Tax=Pecten maximus TaxID=6579 RepID=UPI001458D385|nr:LOW QUALITY PROTEIN: active breakpoint cluster region-related protein-like [Pecten maximus]
MSGKLAQEIDMDVVAFFAGEWRKKFPSVNEPDLLKLDIFSSRNMSFSELQQLHEDARLKVINIKSQLDQAEFMEDFLSNILTVRSGRDIGDGSYTEASDLTGVTKISVGSGKDGMATNMVHHRREGGDHMGGQAVTKITVGDHHEGGSGKTRVQGLVPRGPGTGMSTGKKQVGTDFSCTWLDNLTGIQKESGSSSEEETDVDNTQVNSLPEDFKDKNFTGNSRVVTGNLATVVLGTESTDTTDVFHTNHQNSDNLRTSLTSLGEDDINTGEPSDSQYYGNNRQSVSDRVKSVERKISCKKTFEGHSEPSVEHSKTPPPPRPRPISRPRLSRPKPPPFSRNPSNDTDPLPQKSENEPELTSSLKYRRPADTNLDTGPADDPPSPVSIDNKSEIDPTHCRSDSADSYRSGNETETTAIERITVTSPADTDITEHEVVYVSQDCGNDSGDDSMKKIRKLSRGYSKDSETQNVLGTSFRKFPDSVSDEVVDTKNNGDIVDTKNNGDLSPHNEEENFDTGTKRSFEDVVKRIKDRELHNTQTTSSDKKKKSNYLNVSLNVLLTQIDRLKVSDDSSDSENEDGAGTRDAGDIPGETNTKKKETDASNTQDGSRLSIPDVQHTHRKKVSTTSIDTQSDEDTVDRRHRITRTRSEDDLDTISCDSHDELDVADQEEETEKSRKLKMRKILVNGILDSEENYLSCLDELVSFKRKLQMSCETNPLCSFEDLTTIFYKVEDIHVHHKTFVSSLKEKVDQWSDDQEIGRIFKELIVFFPTYKEFVENTNKALECVTKCGNENPDFKKMALNLKIAGPQSDEWVVSSLEEILFKPVQRLQRNTLVLHDLIRVTPEDHKDFATLQGALKIADHNLRNFGVDEDANDKSEDKQHLVKSGFVVEIDGRSRKLRYLFLFSDVLVCTKHKISGRHKVRSFECKWFIPMPEMVMAPKGDKVYDCKEDIDAMKKKIVSLKAELRSEMKNAEPNKERWSLAGKVQQRSIDKLRKKIEEQEASLVLASPHMPITFSSKGDKKYIILLSNDFEREEWRDAIDNQLKHHSSQGQTHNAIQRQLSIHDIQTMINDSKQLPQVNKIGNVLMRKDDEMLNGNLNVTIHTLAGVDEPCEVFCQLELDSYGHFFMKARTTISTLTHVSDRSWDEDFELELDGSQTLRILCYKKDGTMDELIGRSALELSNSWLSSTFKEQKISMSDLALTISVRHTPTSKTLKRQPSKIQGGVFGVRLKNILSRESKTIPTIVTTCMKEIEARGLDEVGIYRVSGVTSEIQRLKKTFDKNMRAGINAISSCDIHAVSGVLKLFFRELPDPLFTEANYKAFISTVGLKDLPSKEKCMLQLLHDLPDENYYTIVSVIEHLVKVVKCESENKMSISNLATVFGPTLLQPAVSDSKLNPAQIMMQGAQDVFTQAEVLSFFLNMCSSGRSIRRSSTY